MNGVLLLNKSAGPTSHDMVDRIRQLTGIRRVGHAGTLDPFATGLLVMLLGSATKISNFLLNQDKTYSAEITFGTATDTMDLTGEVVETSETPLPARDTLENVLAGFVGDFLQTPPMYSAKKVNGRPLYVAARRGEEVQRESKQVQIESLELLDVDGNIFCLRVACSKGTYVRSLADAIARRLGGVGHLSALHRESSGSFAVDDALTIEQVEQLIDSGTLADHLLSPAQALADYRGVVLTSTAGQALLHGRRPTVDGIAAPGSYKRGEIIRLLTEDGNLLAMGRALLDDKQTKRQAGSVSPFELLRVFSS